jgi:EAL and modified HD-GYP domain-containing signal transduction protein
MQNIYIGRQPIIDSDENLCAYEVLYKGSKALQSRYSSASIINNVLNKFGTKSLLGKRKAFIKIDELFLMHDIIFSIPSDFFIFSIDADVVMSEKVIERMEKLSDLGYYLSINSVCFSEENMQKYQAIYKQLSFIKIDIAKSEESILYKLIPILKSESITVVADSINDEISHTEAQSLGCDWFQGYFFAAPKIIENVEYEPSRAAVFKLYNLLLQDVNIDEITNEFEHNHELSVQLLQFINSGAFHFQKRISSIHHVLTLVGRIPLSQWLMLMIYSKSMTTQETSPLMLMVKQRTQLMQDILKAIEPHAGTNMLGEAYFVGVLSLIDTVFGVRLSTVLKQINISDEVESALLRDEGVLGEIFMLVRSIEAFHTQNFHLFEEKYSLSSGTIEKIVMLSMEELNHFEEPLAL